jgi:hypothetical protein
MPCCMRPPGVTLCRVFLGYHINDQGSALAVHPLHGGDTYPVSLFTSAAAHCAVCSSRNRHAAAKSAARLVGSVEPSLLRVQHLDLPPDAQSPCRADVRVCRIGSCIAAAVPPSTAYT